jgi:hypothetical protein
VSCEVCTWEVCGGDVGGVLIYFMHPLISMYFLVCIFFCMYILTKGYTSMFFTARPLVPTPGQCVRKKPGAAPRASSQVSLFFGFERKSRSHGFTAFSLG